VVLEAVDLLVRIATAFSKEYLGILEDGSVDRHKSVEPELFLEALYDSPSSAFGIRKKIPEPFKDPWLNYGSHAVPHLDDIEQLL
jgi:hypothetical protein